MAVQAVGTLLLFALVVTPAATAIMLTARPGAAMAVATVLAVVSVWAGLAVSAMFNVPPSFVIVTIVSRHLAGGLGGRAAHRKRSQRASAVARRLSASDWTSTSD